MEVTKKVEGILNTLMTLQTDISDMYNATPKILETLSTFAKTGLTSLVSAIEELEDEVEALETRIDELESEVEEEEEI